VLTQHRALVGAAPQVDIPTCDPFTGSFGSVTTSSLLPVTPLNFLESPCEGLAAVALRAAAGLRAAGSLHAAGSSLAGDLPAVQFLRQVGSPWGFVGLVLP